MKPERIDYDALIESLADGAEVDWSALERAATTDEDRRRYGNLRLVARMAELHRTLGLEKSDDYRDLSVEANPPSDGPIETWGHLQIRERIASGAFGDVYIAHDPQLDRQVALKLLRPAPRRPLERQLEEGRTLARVRHHNVVLVYGADVRDGRAGLWMEHIKGLTLEAWLRSHGPMGPGEVVAVATDLCRALAAVHGAGLVHGDVKAQNVMREAGGRIVLMDFGSGQAEGAGAVTGTPLYLAPEVLNREPATPRSDIYSLGVLLFHLLTCRFPCVADDLESLRAAHADCRRVYLHDLRPELPGRLVDAVERALDRDPARRFATPGEMERALTSGADSSPPTPSRRARGWMRGAFALGLATLAAAALMWLWQAPVGPGGSIAVLPFQDGSVEADHLMEGLTADVVRELQRFNLVVKSGRGATPLVLAGAGDIASEKLGADALVRGTARQSGDRTALRVTIDRPSGREWWSREYNVGADALPALARQIAADVAEAIGASPRAGAPVPSHQPNYRAYTAYLKGRVEADERSPESLKRSLAYFEQAAALDPDYAEPYAGMADTYLTMGVPAFGALSPLESRRLAKASALKALEINPNLVEAHTSLAFAAFVHDWDWPEADARFKKALTINPQYALAHHWYAELLNSMRRFDEALAEIREAQALDPLSILIHRDIAWHYFCQARYAEAVAQLRETLKMDPNYSAALTLLARSLAGLGHYSEALAELERARVFISRVAYLGFRGAIEAAAGQRGQAERTLAELREFEGSAYVPPYALALIYTALGEHDEALTQLEEGYRQQDTTMVSVNIDPRFEPLRDEPRFQALIARMNFPHRH